MVVSAILTTALAPITGALFGASYGTAIRIGYEIMFPALFGDVINQQKNNPSKLQEEGSKRTIQSMHKMFTAVGGASAMEFGIEQGIEMAKKKTESPDVQDMIDLSLGLTPAQLNKRGKAQQFQDPLKSAPGPFTKVGEFFEKNLGDFQGQTNREIQTFFKNFTKREPFDIAFKLLVKEKGNTTFTQQIWLLRPAIANVQTVIDAKSTGIVNKIATMFNELNNILKTQTNNKFMTSKTKKLVVSKIKIYNAFVQANRHRNLTIDVAKTVTFPFRIVKRF